MREEKIGRLIARFAVPAIIRTPVSSLYNIVDPDLYRTGCRNAWQCGDEYCFSGIYYMYSYGTSGWESESASNYNLEAGAGRNDRAAEIAGNGLAMLVICGVVIGAVVFIFLNPLLHLFGVTKEDPVICAGLYRNYGNWYSVSDPHYRW